MRVGIDIAKALGPLDGLARYARGLLGGLAELAGEERYRLYPLLEDAPEERFRELFPAAGERFVFAGRRAPAPGEVDIFHCTAWAVPRGVTAPLVFTLYDLTFLTHPDAHTVDNRLHCLRGLARGLARGALPIAISESTRRDAARLLGVAESAVEVIPPGVDGRFQPRAKPEVAAVRRRLGLGEPYLLTVGTREPRKNLTTLLTAYARLPVEIRAGHLLAVVGGGGWLGEDLAAEASRLGIGERVRWLGRVADADLPALYSGAAAFAYPSLYEGFGLPPLEAMACGVPVVVSDVASLPEVVGDAGERVEPGSADALAGALAALLADPDRRRELSRRGRERAAGFTWREAARRTREVYRRAAGAAAHGGTPEPAVTAG